MRRCLVPIASVLIAGCASDAQEVGPAPLAPAAGQPMASSGYQLSEKELKLDCAKLGGVVRMRQMQVREAESRKGPNEAGRAMHEVAVALNGAPKRGSDPAADTAQDRALIEAYKLRMAEKKCKPLEEYVPNAKPAAKAK